MGSGPVRIAQKLLTMKRGALSEPEGALQRLEKAAKENDAEPQLVEADSLLEQLRSWTPAEPAALRWQQALQSRDIWSLDDLVGLAHNERGWNKIVHEELNDITTNNRVVEAYLSKCLFK